MFSIRVEFLTDDERLKKICHLYWELAEEPNFTHSVTSLARDFALSSRDLKAIVDENCNAFSSNHTCPRCEQPQIYTSRSEYQQKYRWGETDELCAVCVSEEREIQKAQRLAEIEHQRKIIQETFPLEPRKPLDIHSISFEDAVYLLAFVRIGASEDLSYFGPLSAVTQPLSPTESYNVEIVRQLFKNGLLIIHPMTPPDVFIFENGEPVSMGLPQVYWALTTGNDVEATRQLVIKLETTLRTKEWWPYRWHDQRLQLWRKVALNECLEYLAVVLKEHQLPLNFGEKTLLVVTELLESYSVGQAYNMIWRAGRDAAAFYMRERVAKQHAANTVVGSIQRQVDRARVERWELKPFKRDRRCPQSMVSQVLFNVALQIGQVGFDETPKLDD